jgi:hypothetical protein
LSVTIEQHLLNGQATWVHVSTRGVTRIGRTFPGRINVDPEAAARRLLPRQIRALTGIRPPPITEEDAWREIFRVLDQIDPATIAQLTTPPSAIPRTAMRSLFQECRTHTSLDSQARWARQLTPTALASAFTTSVDQFRSYRNVEPFYPATRPALPVPSPGQRILDNRDLAILLNAQKTAVVVNDPSLNFRYVDYEVVPARNTGRATYADGKKGTTWVRLDQLLVVERPAIAEVKLRNDKNPFYALVQVLTAAAELLTPAQRDRLGQHYPQLGAISDPTVDIYVITYRSHENGPTWHQLRDQTEDMCRALSAIRAVRQHIARFALLELQDPMNGVVSFQSLFAI